VLEGSKWWKIATDGGRERTEINVWMGRWEDGKMGRWEDGKM
jgi:hypothetical protein